VKVQSQGRASAGAPAAAERARAEAAADRAAAERERAEAQRLRDETAAMLAAAGTDELTGAWSRRFGLEELERMLARAYREGTPVTLVFVDVDKLKRVNDLHGHQAGDELLALIGEVVRAHLRSYDVVVRYGGDEFVCGIANFSEGDARARFDDIATILKLLDRAHSISFGVAEALPGESLHRLIMRADAALLHARETRPPA
jgi:diguanylate cyclase (GGDEF)-like protein